MYSNSNSFSFSFFLSFLLYFSTHLQNIFRLLREILKIALYFHSSILILTHSFVSCFFFCVCVFVFNFFPFLIFNVHFSFFFFCCFFPSCFAVNFCVVWNEWKVYEQMNTVWKWFYEMRNMWLYFIIIIIMCYCCCWCSFYNNNFPFLPTTSHLI